MLDLNLYLIIFVFLFFTALFMILQIKLEKELLKNFPQNNSYIKKFISEEAPLNEFSIPLIMLSWLPLSARGRTVLFNSNIKCIIYKEFILFQLETIEKNIFERIVYKKDIQTKWDLFAGHVISFKVQNIKLTCKVHSRIENFKLQSKP
ncbi:MAG: hypothetical protein KIC80_10560 [Brachyspira sp.]|nr:hypothetical protein [Brachyspira sp.]